MALIPKYHTAVAMFPVDPADVSSLNSGGAEATYALYQGMVLGLNSSGYVKRASNSVLPIGLAGDTMASSASHGAYADTLVINPGGARKSTQNRLSDYFNETLGSGLMTVYIVGGEFYTDKWVNGTSFTVGSSVKASNASPGYIDGSGSNSIGVCTSGAAGYPSGVPGAINAVDYSMPLKTSNSAGNNSGFISFIMQL